jgi:putative nucleotidyltransferase with HDIG domain
LHAASNDEGVEVGPTWWPAVLATELLQAELPDRLLHVFGTARQAGRLRGVDGIHLKTLEPAAMLHDVGYASDLVDTGFHAIDGARYLRAIGVDDEIVRVVAHHSCAAVEADLRGLSGALAAFERPPPLMAEAMIFCDMTCGPRGELLTAEERIADILVRHEGSLILRQFIDRARSELLASTARMGHLAAVADHHRTMASARSAP